MIDTCAICRHAIFLALIIAGLLHGAAPSAMGADRDDIILSSEVLGLSHDELRWLEKHPTVQIGGPKSFPPFHYFDSQGNLKGISADYIHTIMGELGIKVIIQDNLPWPEVLKRAREKKLDLIPCAAKTQERKRFLRFTSPYLSFPLVIVTRRDALFVGGIEDLQGKALAVIRKNSTMDWLERDGIDYTPVFVDSPLKRLEAVSFGMADAGIENLAATSYLVEKNGLTNLKIAAPTPYGNYNLHMAVRNDWPELVSILDKALGAIMPLEHARIRSEWLSPLRVEHGIRWSDVIKWISIILLFIVPVLTVVMISNRRLNREVKMRKKSQEEKETLIIELRGALNNIKTLKGLLPICSKCKKIRDDKGYWNNLETYIETHSDASFSHGICRECMEDLYGAEEWFVDRKNRLVE
ncbi:MAG: hypothetical protein D3926_05480 [Desulfobacteraceae bacterium]|nr:MAG: hypothetical protein D3926_05480 [Desulfobacteraceae bacterium]